MGEHRVSKLSTPEARISFIRHLLNDLRTLELMLKKDVIEKGITRIGTEQEFCLVTDHWRPAKNSEKILSAINDPHFTTELARYNLEINLDPLELKTDCFTKLENQLNAYLKQAAEVAKKFDTKVLLAGILPTISKNEVELDYMTPSPRYWTLNDSIKELRGKDFEMHIRGVDELSITHDSVLFEACNTSFQMHLQVDPDAFIANYNWAQAISGPVLGICTNSPLLLGRELWSETRIALFQQSIDTRISSYALQDQLARVMFGNEWEEGSIAEIYKHDIARHKIIISRDIENNSMEVFNRGETPKLEALNLHNGTIYRWNRPCYGVAGNKAHVRIENRYIPAGPSTIDEIANFAFWAGLMMGRPEKYDNIAEHMDFRDAKSNFFKAARTGKESVLRWMDIQISVRELIIKHLLPMAYAGLEKANIDKNDIERLLGIIEQRAINFTGTQWSIRTYRNLRRQMKRDDALVALTKTIYEHQQTNLPVHEWPVQTLFPKADESAHLVSHIMSTQLFYVNENDLAELATSVMDWKNIHHVPVQNNEGRLTGLLTWTHMIRSKEKKLGDENSIVAEIMTKRVEFAHPNTEIKDAIKIMKKNEYGCLPVIQDQLLVGIITIKDVVPFDNA